MDVSSVKISSLDARRGYAQEHIDETGAAQGEFVTAVGTTTMVRRIRGMSCGLEFPASRPKTPKKNGGDDGTRTRGLCREPLHVGKFVGKNSQPETARERWSFRRPR